MVLGDLNSNSGRDLAPVKHQSWQTCLHFSQRCLYHLENAQRSEHRENSRNECNTEILFIYLEGFFCQHLDAYWRKNPIFWLSSTPFLLPKQFSCGGKDTGLAISERLHLGIWDIREIQQQQETFLWTKYHLSSCREHTN